MLQAIFKVNVFVKLVTLIVITIFIVFLLRQVELVKLFHICHSKMEDVIQNTGNVKVISFNLGYLPGGDKEKVTIPETTLLALQAASRILVQGGVISVVVYVRHAGGM